MTNLPIISAPKLDLKNKSILRISIDGKWTALEFTNFFANLDVLYTSMLLVNAMFQAVDEFSSDVATKNIKFITYKHSPIGHKIDLLRHELRGNNLLTLENAGKYVHFVDPIGKFEPLAVTKISFASPGFTDFLGLSGILKELRQMITYYFPNKKDKEEIEVLKQQKIAQTISNLKALGLSDIEIRTIILREDVQLQNLAELVKTNHIKKIEVIDNNV